MPIASPDLDDLRYRTVLDLMVQQIPVVAPEWTNHNDNDPGIALLQLFSFLTEQVGYRLNRVPEKNYVEFLRLIGVRLRPAEAARTVLNFILAKPELAQAFAIKRGARIRARAGEPPPVFETDSDLDAVPAQLAALITTASEDLRDLRVSTDTDSAVQAAGWAAKRLTVAWDGKTPKLKDLPASPVPLFAQATTPPQQHLWIGLAFNPSPAAGFLGQRVTLTLQMDDDEQPSPLADVRCGAPVRELSDDTDPNAPSVGYEFFRPAQPGETQGQWRELKILSDTTDGWTRSGKIRFDVPAQLGPIPDGEWKRPYSPPEMTLAQICAAASGADGSSPPPKAVAHPLVGALKNPVQGTPSMVPVSGWLHVVFPNVVPSFRLRALSFNCVEAVHAQTVQAENVGLGNAQPGQVVRLAHGNVLPGTLELSVTDPTDGLLHRWTEVSDFDAQSPDARVYVLDPEAGEITFGDGIRGKPPPDRQRIVAQRYRWGGGKAAELGPTFISKPEGVPSAVQDVTNIVSARGGKDAESLAEAKQRAPRELKTMGRAVTVEDFRFFTERTPGIRVARAEVVPLHIPYANVETDGPGLDLETDVPGALSVIVVPDAPSPWPTPTAGMLRKVCAHLDRFRLVTTEVHCVPPQYVRLFGVTATVVAKPGYTRTQLREAVAKHLETYFHVLKGGPDGQGFPFGGVIHHADVVARIFAVEGVAAVETVEAWFDGQAPDPNGGTDPLASWRDERADKMRLTGCIENEEEDVDALRLAADENVWVDASDLNVIVTDA